MIEANLVKKAYIRILPVQVLACVVAAVNSIIDGLITARFIGTQAMAAVGLFVPVCTIIGISQVVSIGVQILCSKYVGNGKKENAVNLFSSGVVFVSLYAFVVSLSCIFFRAPLSSLLGARGETATMLQDYIVGYSFGVIGQVLSGMLMVFLPMNNDMRRSYVAIGVMVTTNVGLDVLFVNVLGLSLFGMGLATSVSFLASALVMILGFVNKRRPLSINLKKITFKEIPHASLLGLPSLMFTLGCTAKAYILNRTLILSVGDAAVAAMNVQNSVCALLGSIPAGCANSFIALGSLYFGEHDRRSMETLMKYSVRVGTIISAVATALVMVCSTPIASAFYSVSDQAWTVTRRMLILFPGFLILNTLFNILMKVYQCQQKLTLVNVLSVSENLIIALLSAVFTPLIGTDAVWLSFPAGEIICLIVVAASVFIRAGRITFGLDDWMKLNRDFGFKEGECLDFTVASHDDVTSVSERVMDFCLKKGIDKRRAMYSGLCIEEMVCNAVDNGFNDGKNHTIDIRVVTKNGLTLRIRDDCKEFDPEKRLEQYVPDKDDVMSNIGVRIVAGLAREMTYRPIAGINTLLIKL